MNEPVIATAITTLVVVLLPPEILFVVVSGSELYLCWSLVRRVAVVIQMGLCCFFFL
jgi:hypothetical protein